jgi:hypothetical protein
MTEESCEEEILELKKDIELLREEIIELKRSVYRHVNDVDSAHSA